jgi:sulfate permease, SulP family
MGKRSIFRNMGSFIPIFDWLPKYEKKNIRWDIVAGVTLASFVLPESMAYATLAGVPAYYGIYCCLAGGLLFAFFTTSKHVAVGPTSAISLMVGSTVAVLSGGEPLRWAAIAELTALVVACICFTAYIFKLSSLVNFISDSILLGFKAGAALSIMATQLPKLFAVGGGGSNFFSRLMVLFGHLPETNWIVFCFGFIALIVLIAGDKILPGRPVSLGVVVASILILYFTDLHSKGIHITGPIPMGLPAFGRPSLRFKDVDGVLELGFACFLMGYIETISAARTFAMKNNYTIRPQQELLSLGFANLASAFASGYVVSGGLSQSTVNEKSGARSPLSLVFCSATLVIILLFLTGLLRNLPEVVLAVIVLHAVSGLIKVNELKRVYQLSKLEFSVAMIAFLAVLTFGILKGVLLAVVMSMILLIRRAAHPHVALLGRVGNTKFYTDVERHADNILFDGVLILRIESSVLYFNSEHIQQKITEYLKKCPVKPKLVVIDLSAAPYVDIVGSKMLLEISGKLRDENIQCRLVEALGNVRDILRKQGMEEVAGKLSRSASIQDTMQEFGMAIDPG